MVWKMHLWALPQQLQQELFMIIGSAFSCSFVNVPLANDVTDIPSERFLNISSMSSATTLRSLVTCLASEPAPL